MRLPDPRPQRAVVAEVAEPPVDARKDVLEDVFGVALGQPVGADRDRPHIVAVALDEHRPRRALASSAAGDQVLVGEELERRHRELREPLREPDEVLAVVVAVVAAQPHGVDPRAA